jgi:hypothetical protein
MAARARERCVSLLASFTGDANRAAQSTSSMQEQSIAAEEGSLDEDEASGSEEEEASEDSDTPEEREAPYQRWPTDVQQKKMKRALSDRLMLIDRKRNGSQLSETFKIRGSTGTVYTIVIDKKPRCDCPDATGSDDICKHVIYIFLKVLGLSQSDPRWYQQHLLNSELEEIFNNDDADSTLIDTGYQKAYLAELERAKKPKVSKIKSCPLCFYGRYTSGRTGEEETPCTNAVHKESLEQWKETCQPRQTNCVLCNASSGVGLDENGEEDDRAYTDSTGKVQLPIESSEDYSIFDQKHLYSYSKTALKKMYQQGQITKDELCHYVGGSYFYGGL